MSPPPAPSKGTTESLLSYFLCRSIYIIIFELEYRRLIRNRSFDDGRLVCTQLMYWSAVCDLTAKRQVFQKTRVASARKSRIGIWDLGFCAPVFGGGDAVVLLSLFSLSTLDKSRQELTVETAPRPIVPVSRFPPPWW